MRYFDEIYLRDTTIPPNTFGRTRYRGVKMYLYPVTSLVVFEEWQAWLGAHRDRAQRNRARRRTVEWLASIHAKLEQGRWFQYAIIGRNRTDLFARCTLEVWIEEASTLHSSVRKTCLQLCDQGKHREVEQVLIELRSLNDAIEKSHRLIKSMRVY